MSPRRLRAISFAAAIALCAATAAKADFNVNQDLVVEGQICGGLDCFPTPGIGTETLLLKDQRTAIRFEDTTTNADFAGRDWLLHVNDLQQFGLDRFSIVDLTAGTYPFTILGGAPEAAFYMTANGDLGFGTSLPAADLHVVDGAAPALRLEQDGSLGGTPQTWQITGDDAGLAFSDVTNTTIPLRILPGTTDNTLVLSGQSLGVGTASPLTKMHVSGAGDAAILVSDTAPTSSPRALLNLQNHGRPEIIMGNSATNGEWSFGAGTNFILKTGALGSTSAAKTKALTLYPNGDLTIEGVLTTQGTACGGGCDRVFAPDYKLPTITEHAAQMHALGYLPNIGPTPEGAPINVSDKLGRMLNELEHAHIYIAQQEKTITALRSEQAAIRAELAAIRSLLKDE